MSSQAIQKFKAIIAATAGNPEEYAALIDGLETLARNVTAKKHYDSNTVTTAFMVVAIEMLIARDGAAGAAHWLARCADVLLGDEEDVQLQ